MFLAEKDCKKYAINFQIKSSYGFTQISPNQWEKFFKTILCELPTAVWSIPITNNIC